MHTPHDTEPFTLRRNLRMRWANPENYDAKPGAGGQAVFGRKGSACRGALQAGETWVLADAKGSGMVRRIWITVSDRGPEMLRGLVIRMYWDGAAQPAVEAPLGDLFANPLGRTAIFENAWFDNPEGRNFNSRLPMPFRTACKITVTNESPTACGMFWYHIDYTIGDVHDESVGYFHAYWNRENPTTIRRDFEILPRVSGWGRYLGCSIGVIADTARFGKSWWGEGEAKIYLDGDTDFPTLCGTGTEDYICTSWGQGQFATQWYGCPLADGDRMQFSFYRLHGPDPVFFEREIRVTIQQIGCYYKPDMVKFMRDHKIPELVRCDDGSGRLSLAAIEQGGNYSLFERTDDWSACAWFYLDKPAGQLPPIQPYAERVAGLTASAEATKRIDA